MKNYNLKYEYICSIRENLNLFNWKIEKLFLTVISEGAKSNFCEICKSTYKLQLYCFQMNCVSKKKSKYFIRKGK